MKGIIIYRGKYGATEQYAQWLSESLHLSFIKASEVTPAILDDYDTVFVGSSVYIGKLAIGKWMTSNLEALTRKKIVVFIVCGTLAGDKEGQRRIIENNLDPAILKVAKVFFLPGRCVVSKLSWMDRFIIKTGAMLEKDILKKASMSQGFDRMDRKSLDSLIAAIGTKAEPPVYSH